MEIAGWIIQALLALDLWFAPYTPVPVAKAAVEIVIDQAAVDAEPERSVNEALAPNCGRKGTPRCVAVVSEPQ